MDILGMRGCKLGLGDLGITTALFSTLYGLISIVTFWKANKRYISYYQVFLGCALWSLFLYVIYGLRLDKADKQKKKQLVQEKQAVKVASKEEISGRAEEVLGLLIIFTLVSFTSFLVAFKSLQYWSSSKRTIVALCAALSLAALSVYYSKKSGPMPIGANLTGTQKLGIFAASFCLIPFVVSCVLPYGLVWCLDQGLEGDRQWGYTYFEGIVLLTPTIVTFWWMFDLFSAVRTCSIILESPQAEDDSNTEYIGV